MAVTQGNSTEYTPRVNYKTNRSSALYWIISHLKRFWYLFSLVIFFTMLNSIFTGLVPGYISRIFDLYNEGILTLPQLQSLSLTVLFLGSGAGVIQLLRSWSNEFIAQRMERDIRDELYSSLLGKSLTFHDKQKIGDLMTRATTDVRQIYYMFSPGFNLVFQSIVSAIVPIILIGLIDYRLLLVPINYLIVFVIVLRRYNRSLAPWAMKSRRAASKTQARLNEAITGMHVVRGSAKEEKEREIFNENIREFEKAQVKLGEIQAKYWPLFLLGIATTLAILHGVILINTGIIGIADLIEFILLMQLLRFPTFINIFAITVLTLGIAAAERIIELIEGESEIDLNPEGYSAEVKGNIEFRNVTFGYSPDTPVLKNLSFSIKPGQTVALVGMTGSGKTTITKLLARLYDPQEGQILVDGVNLREWSIESLRSQMAVVEQDIFLFSKSVKENIVLGEPDASKGQIEKAANLAHAHDFIMELEDGYDTEIGERGANLSGGQRQRVAIARAVVKNPNILILDDASSAIDSKTEDEINLAIKDVLQGRISFLITHRLAQIRRADVIVLLDQGEIIDIGDHNFLISNSHKYREIFSIYDDFEEKLAFTAED